MGLRALIGICGLAALAACAPRTPSVGAAPATWPPDAPADSVATWALRSCRSFAGVDPRCVERALYRVVESAGVAHAISALDRVVVIAPALLADAHGIAHGLGIAAYRSPETLAATFASCPLTQISGCQHGLIQGYFLALKREGRAVDAAVLDAVCAPHREAPAAFFQCAHGLGHGVMAFEQGHLPRALERCDGLSDALVRESCYGGAFMENIVAVTHPHHSAESHAEMSHGAHDARGGRAAPAAGDGHAHHAAGAGHGSPPAAWVPLRRDDLLYPCTAVEARYHAACYDIQSSAAIALTQGSIEAVARACAQAPAAHVRRCYASLGRDVSAMANLGHARAIALCERAGAEASTSCLAGVAAALHNRSNNPADAIAFCRSVPAGAGKSACYQVVTRVITYLSVERRTELCAAADPEYAARCRAAGADETSDE